MFLFWNCINVAYWWMAQLQHCDCQSLTLSLIDNHYFHASVFMCIKGLPNLTCFSKEFVVELPAELYSFLSHLTINNTKMSNFLQLSLPPCSLHTRWHQYFDQWGRFILLITTGNRYYGGHQMSKCKQVGLLQAASEN